MIEKFRKFAHLTLTAMVAVVSMFVGLIGVGSVAPAHAQLNLPRIPWEGGPAYWAQFPKAATSGWTDPSFFPISVFLPNPSDAAALRALGINLAMGVNFDNDTSYTPRISKITDPDHNSATEDGLYAMPHKEYEGTDNWTPTTVGNDPRAVAWFITDECEMGFSGCGNGEWTQYEELDVQTSRSEDVRDYNDGRFQHSNFGNGVARTFWSPDTMDEHIKLMDSSSVDKYAYTSPDVGGTDGVIRQSRNWPSSANARTAAAYGWIADQMRLFQEAEPSPGDPTPAEPEGRRPVWVFVETAKPLLNETGATTITPDQMEGAVWAGIIHEARGVAYFPQNNDSCGGYSVINVDNQSQSCLDQLEARQDKLTAIHAKIQSLAPVLNTQSYVWNFSDDSVASNNTNTMLKSYNGYAYIFAHVGLEYAGRDTNECDTINLEQVCQQLGTNQATGTKNFILPSGVTGTTVEVVGENRTIPVVSGQFTDNFPNEYTHHVYKIALDPNATPTLTLSVSPMSVAPGGTGTATWANIPSPTATDWLGLYTSGASDTAYLAWRYTTGTASGNVPFTIPGTLTPGTYELRLLSNNGFTRLATSNAFTVTPGMSVPGRVANDNQ